MKCPSCHYERRTHTILVKEATFYKSGPKKDQLKGYENNIYTVYEDDPVFLELSCRTETYDDDDDADTQFLLRNDNGPSPTRTLIEKLYVCPKCGTVFVPYAEL